MAVLKYAYGENKHKFCANPVEFLEEAEQRGLSRAEIARIAGVDQSSIRNWLSISQKNPDFPKGYSSMKPIIKLKAYLDGYGMGKTFDQPTQKNGIVEFDLLIEYGKRLGLINLSGDLTISNEILKEIFLRKTKL